MYDRDVETMKSLSTLTLRELFTGWWAVRWIRTLVLILIPIGIIDTLYTIGMTNIYGYEIEFNPVTRELLAAGYWLPWSFFNIMGFTIFCMMTGSYYLHTRSRLGGPDTFVFSLIIALRIAMVGYNVTFYYLPWIAGMVYPPFWTASFTFIFSLYLMNKLLNRQYDVSWFQTKYFFSSRFNNYRDAKLINSTGAGKDVSTGMTNSNREANAELTKSLPIAKKTWRDGAWRKRVIYLSGALFSFVLMGFSIQIISDVTGLSRGSEIHGPFFILNEVTGPPVMASFLAIIVFISLSLLFIFKAFSTTEEIPF
jgi:hypothetical protein